MEISKTLLLKLKYITFSEKVKGNIISSVDTYKNTHIEIKKKIQVNEGVDGLLPPTSNTCVS